MVLVSAIDEIVSANADYSADAPALASRPARALAVVTCMDARLDLLAPLGLQVGDAHFMRTAGGIVNPDVLRSLAISQRALGTREVLVLHHTACGMDHFDDDAFRAELAAETGRRPSWDVPGFTDVEASVRASVEQVRSCPWLPHRDEVRGFVYDVTTRRIHEVR